MTNKRIAAIIIIFLAILFLPWWIYLPLLFIAIALLPMFWEGVFLGFLVDVLYGEGLSLPFISPVALVTLVALIIFLPLREHLRAYV